jgi:aminoglycoside phosphotransferase (APT) family kinase protein
MNSSPDQPSASQELAALLPPLQRMGLLLPHETPTFTALTGGVSSLIVRVDTPRQSFCLKRALPQLKVAALWEAPVKRNRDEVAWLRFAAQHLPHAVPALLGEDQEDCVFAMAFLPSEQHPVWKNQLQAGVVSTQTAQRVAQCLATWHAASAGQADLAQAFDHDADFIAIRLDPYFNATALRHPDCAQALHGLVKQTLKHKHVLVHGDVSPKNILVGPQGPVFLDAECAWYGDPAFDLAFVLNHLLLKCLWKPAHHAAYLDCFDALASTYLSAVNWEDRNALEARTCALLAGMLLARVDGKSPVEYITTDTQREQIRHFAKPFLLQPATLLQTLRQHWTP